MGRISLTVHKKTSLLTADRPDLCTAVLSKQRPVCSCLTSGSARTWHRLRDEVRGGGGDLLGGASIPSAAMADWLTDAMARLIDERTLWVGWLRLPSSQY